MCDIGLIHLFENILGGEGRRPEGAECPLSCGRLSQPCDDRAQPHGGAIAFRL